MVRVLVIMLALVAVALWVRAAIQPGMLRMADLAMSLILQVLVLFMVQAAADLLLLVSVA